MNSEQLLEEIIKEFNLVYPDVEFTVNKPNGSGRQIFFADGQMTTMIWSEKLADDLIHYNSVNLIDKVKEIYLEQLPLSMSVLQKSNEEEEK